MTTTAPACQGRVHPYNLPTEVAAFIGREREMDELKRLIVRIRLRTLTGAGGCGKTCLAVRVASEMVPSFADGV